MKLFLVAALSIFFVVAFVDARHFNNSLIKLDVLLARFTNFLGIQSATQESSAIENAIPSRFSELALPIYVKPTHIVIESIAVDIPLVELGLSEDGTLEAPTAWGKGGWYKKSARPGERGNLIINGHYDNSSGQPAAFWQLKNVSLNDKVMLVDELGKYHTYVVTDIFYVDVQDPQRLQIFESSDDKTELTLITCGGVWVPGDGYSRRLVVKAHLAS